MRAVVIAVLVFSFVTACGKKAKPTPAAEIPGTQIRVTSKGFEPDRIAVKKGVPTTLVFTRQTDKTCAKDVVIKLGDGTDIKRDLPLDQPTAVTVTFPTAGELRYACSMDMITGVITVE